MKQLLFILSFLFAFQSNSQTMEDFFNNKEQVVLLGLDFTQAKFIDKDAFPNPEGLKLHSIKNWNRFFASEPNKYSLQDALGLKDKYYYNSINYFLKRNEAMVDEFRCITNEPYELTEDQIVETVSSYKTFEKEGLAISFVVESFDKTENRATVWVTFISLPDNTIIYKEKMTGTPGGGGQVNYWARAIYDIVSQIEKRKDEFKSIQP